MRKKNHFNFLASLAMIAGGMLPVSASVYDAHSVIINIGVFSGENFNYTYLGDTRLGYQIWGWIKNTTSSTYPYWKIDNGPNLSREDPFSRGCNYHIDNDYSSSYVRETSSYTNDSYFLKVNSQTSANVIYCAIGADISSKASDFYVQGEGEAFLQPYTYEGSYYKLRIAYNISGPSDALFKDGKIEVSYDEGSTWSQVGKYAEMSSSFNATVPWDKTKVRYRLTTYPQDRYRSVVEGGCWTYTTEDWPLEPTGISCGIDKAPTADELKSSYNAEIGTFIPEITWSTSENMTQAFKSVGLYYSYDNGNNWILTKTVMSAKGTVSISVEPGHTSYMFRIVETPCDALADIDAFKPSNTAQGIEVSYNPAIDSITLAGKVTDGYNEKDNTYTHTVKVAVNPDLHMTMKDTDRGYINYSTDGGKTWSDNIPVSFDALTGEATITVPVKDSYMYRFSANSYVDGTATAVTATSKVYTADGSSGIDTVGSDSTGDNSPVDVYNLAGNLVARQILLSKASDILGNGIYVVKGKVIVINK